MEDNKKCLYLYNKNMNKKQEKRNNPSCFGRNNSSTFNISRNKLKLSTRGKWNNNKSIGGKRQNRTSKNKY